MKPVQLRARVLGIAGACALLSTTLLAQGEPPLPPAEEVLDRVIERAKQVREQNRRGQYAYTQRSVREELDGSGSVKKREERLYHVFPIAGVPYRKLVEKDGAPLSEKEQKAEEEHERKRRQELAQAKRENADEEDQVVLDEALTGRFHFETIAREPVQGRPTLVLTFAPKSKNLPVRRKLDRFLNKLAGTVWIDAQNYDIARVEAHLVGKVTTWAGILLSVRVLEVALELAPVDDGVWLPRQLDQYVDARVLFLSKRVQQQHYWSDFRKVKPEDREQKAEKQ